MAGWKMNFLLGWLIFRSYVNFREGRYDILVNDTFFLRMEVEANHFWINIHLSGVLFSTFMIMGEYDMQALHILLDFFKEKNYLGCANRDEHS